MENRKTQILKLALDLIREKGYVAFSYDDISKQLGLTKATIHYHFEKKEDLALAITDMMQQSLQGFLISMSNTVSIPVEEKIKQLILKQFEIAGNGICPLSSLQADYESLPEAVQLRVEKLSQFELKCWNDILREAQKEGIVHNAVDIESLAYAVISCIKGGMQYKRVLKRDILPQIEEQVCRLIKS
ncbi:TetR/AcrR family transcriptional regulator [Paenibacillus glycinis]|uniref:TetR family transcriptional regulator n=1 Tax=Paenibacillus glycinis TaxID=2697035 RepID=A0ABW9XKD1_9BACL|nr:TetR/AcrR family transcriptional regulator [Paenibacillus glycinis]NBD23089.1 TetR family transcriptional regulator [Paenibacillus glycinis]